MAKAKDIWRVQVVRAERSINVEMGREGGWGGGGRF